MGSNDRYRNNYSPDTVWGYYMVPADNVGLQRAWGGDMWLWDLEVLGYLVLDDAPLAKLPVLIAHLGRIQERRCQLEPRRPRERCRCFDHLRLRCGHA